MGFIEIPEFPILGGEQAVKALQDFIKELEEQRGKELTEKQAATLIKIAKGLIASIEAETRSSVSKTGMPRRVTFSANLDGLLKFFKRHRT